ncbi:MAG: ETEC_3214 domain-containing protein [Patescibacteria group bacterium]|jgi:hypothetical protein
MVKQNIKFKDTIPGIIILSIIASAIWYFLTPHTQPKNNLVVGGSNIIQGSNASGDMIAGDKISGNKIVNYPNSTVTKIKEYVFINSYCSIIALTDEYEKILAYSITSLDESFHPELQLNNYYGIKATSTGDFESKTDTLNFKLGETTFKEIEDLYGEATTTGVMGVNTFYYEESYYLARSGNYQTQIFSINENGIGLEQLHDDPPYYINPEYRDSKKNEIENFRKITSPNTYTITEPFFNIADTLENHEFGPMKMQINLLSKNLRSVDKTYLLNSIKSLHPQANISSFIKLFGEPDFINNN